MALGSKPLLMAVAIRENGLLETRKEWGYMIRLVVTSMKGIVLTILNMAMVYTNRQMAIAIGGIMLMEKRRERECLFGRMATSTKECG